MNLSTAIDEFLASISGKAQNTRDSYRTGLNRFVAHLGDQTVDALSLNQIVTFAGVIQETCATRTRRTYLVAVRRFYRWLIETRALSLDAADVVRLDGLVRDLVPRSSPLPHVASEAVVQALLSAAGQVPELPPNTCDADKRRAEWRRLRDLALVHALRSSGMRIGELLTLRRGDLDTLKHAATVTGKGSKQRVVYFDEAAWSAMQEYFKARGDGSQARALGDLPIIARHDRGAGVRLVSLTSWRAEHIFGELARRAGIEERVTPHSLRHAFATKVLDATGDLAVVQDMLGHSSPATTRIYAKVSSKRIRDAHRAAFDKE